MQLQQKQSIFVCRFDSDELYYAKFGEVTEDDSTSKFHGTPYMGFGYHGQFGGLGFQVTYHMRSTGDYTVAGDSTEDASQSIHSWVLP